MPNAREEMPQTAESWECPTCSNVFSRDAVFCPFDGTRLDGSAATGLVDPILGMPVDGRYVALEVIGEGGMGRVYKVVHESLGRTFAMKVLRPELARDASLAHRFLHEAQATASIRHPNVVQITDFGRLPDQTPYFVMELLVGQTLGKLLRRSPVARDPGVHIIRRVAAGLGAAHAVGVIHRDLKPDNVFLVQGENPSSEFDLRVVDFGAAKRLGVSGITRSGIVYGSPHYMAPEQARGQPVDARTDVYALGAIMYEMFAGRTPFDGDTVMGILTQHLFVDPIPPSQVHPAAAKELGALENIVMRCLAKDPSRRFASMGDLLEALDAQGGGAVRLPSSPGAQGGSLPPDAAEIRTPAEGRAAESPLTAQSPAPSDPFGATAGHRHPTGGWGKALGAAALALALAALVGLGFAFSAHRTLEPTSRPTVLSAPAPALPHAPAASAAPLPSALGPVAPAPTFVAPISSFRLPARTKAPAPEASTARAPTKLDDVGDPFAAPP